MKECLVNIPIKSMSYGMLSKIWDIWWERLGKDQLKKLK